MNYPPNFPVNNVAPGGKTIFGLWCRSCGQLFNALLTARVTTITILQCIRLRFTNEDENDVHFPEKDENLDFLNFQVLSRHRLILVSRIGAKKTNWLFINNLIQYQVN